MQRFEGKTVLVTGAAAGIGRAVALRLADEGAALLLADRDADGMEQTAAMISGGAACHTYDAAVPGASAEMVEAAVQQAGGLDGLINVAGAYHRAHFAQMTASDWERMLRINLTSVFETCQAALPALSESRGVIVNTASTAGVQGIAYAAAYAAAKGGIITLTQSLGAELAHLGIRVNAVAPGRVRTSIGAGLAPVEGARPELSFHPVKLGGMEDGAAPKDLAGTYAYLASNDACFVTGTVTVVDGGSLAG
ncbi:SDR family NAD(P)-dependent oxidoreductase [Oceanibium sediminis]|uniref:SDR family NAD(P)-dependent oxidoreductase n=1 Tax=Oceanibium sediminis TaxID=2026339 RepID=UPI000DD4502D|nr:SDR family NAD(P)-dependent oxidoreductase [Oceanibium sediminis]